jgi:quercetin dioxygenase-like cupin family protein
MRRTHFTILVITMLLLTGCPARQPAFSLIREASTSPAPSGVSVITLGEGSRSWDGAPYDAYPAGTPYWSILKITLAPNTRLAPHKHPMPNFAYIAEGGLTVIKSETGERKILHQGDVLPEMVNQTHYGETGDAGAVLIVFYAGAKGQKLSIPTH